VAAVGALIAWLTLSSAGPPGVEPLPHGCLICGPHATADAVANVALFTPLGAMLALAGLGTAAAGVTGLVVAAAIELTQYLAIEGRVATPVDVVANAAGALLGAALARTVPAWAHPGPPAARRLWIAWLAGWLAIWIGAAWAFSAPPDAPGERAPTVSTLIAAPPRHGWYAGRVVEAGFDGRRYARRGSGPVLLESADRRGPLRADVRVVGEDARRSPVPILYVHPPGDPAPFFHLGHVGLDAYLQPPTRAPAMRLRAPTLRLVDAFGPAAGDTVWLVASVERGVLELADPSRAGRPHARLALTPALGWALVVPRAPHTPIAIGVITALWLAAGWLPLGYWMRAGATTARSQRTAALAAAAGLLLGQWVVPLGFGLTAAPAWQGVAAVLAALVGAVTARARFTSPSGGLSLSADTPPPADVRSA
jgi:hypothetical protein